PGRRFGLPLYNARRAKPRPKSRGPINCRGASMKLRPALVHLVATTAIVLASFVATATLGFAQAYCPCNGTGNVIDTPLLERLMARMDGPCQSPRKAVQPPQRPVRAVA